MRYATAAAFRQALDDRLKAEAQTTGLGLVRLRKRVAFELFLRRLVAAAPDRWVLKGALVLDFRLHVATRPTRDLDLARQDDQESAIEDLASAQELAMDDFFTFRAVRTEDIEEEDEFSAMRFHVTAELAGKTFERFILDIAFSDPLPTNPDKIETTGFLSFAGIEPLSVPVVPIHQHIAEKVHAYTRRYGTEGRSSTRPKDLVDLRLIESAEAVEARRLRVALQRTFETRDTHPLPAALPPPPTTWSEPYARLARQVGIDEDLSAAYTRVAAFLDPVLAGRTEGRWDPRAASWS
jgi:predicted nucleotidyltransferase component of viral defense system